MPIHGIIFRKVNCFQKKETLRKKGEFLTMEKHITILGVLHIAFNAFGVIVAIILFILLFGIGVASQDEQALGILSVIGGAVSAFLLAISLPGVIAGIGLLGRLRWARILAIVLGILDLLNLPVGTAVGIYTLWVLFNEETQRIFSEDF